MGLAGDLVGAYLYAEGNSTTTSYDALAGSNAGSTLTNVDTKIQGTAASNEIGKLTGTGSTRNSGALHDAATEAQSAFATEAPGGAVAASFDAPPAEAGIPSGTAAFIGRNASITAGRDVRLDSRSRTDITQVAGGFGAGAALGGGAAVAVLSLGESTTTFIGSGDEVNAGRDVSLESHLLADVAVLGITTGIGVMMGMGRRRGRLRLQHRIGLPRVRRSRRRGRLHPERRRGEPQRGQGLLAPDLGIRLRGLVGRGRWSRHHRHHGLGCGARIRRRPRPSGQSGPGGSIGSLSVAASQIVSVASFGSSAVTVLAIAAGGAGLAAGVLVINIGSSGTAMASAEVRRETLIFASGTVRVVSDFTATVRVRGRGLPGPRGDRSARRLGRDLRRRARLIADSVAVEAGSIEIAADNTVDAFADILIISLGAVGGSGARVDVDVDASSEALVGSAGGGTTTLSTTGSISVLATSTQRSRATANGGTGGILIGVAWLIADATLTGTTRAQILGAVSIPRSQGVSVTAQVLSAAASASVVVGSGGVISVGGSQAFATTTPKIIASIGNGVLVGSVSGVGTPVPIAGGVTVSATGRAEANTTANAYGGGGSRSASRGALDDRPGHQALIGTAGAATPTRIYAAGTVRVAAEPPGRQQAQPLRPDHSRLARTLST